MQQLSINLQRTKALLIGASEYKHLPKIAPAMGNLDDLFSVLTNPAILGLPVENITLIRNKRNDEILRTISQFVKNGKNIDVETLILYYVGHGVREVDSKKLYLTGTNSDSEIIAGSAILYDDIKNRIENSPIQHRIVLLDACHAKAIVSRLPIL